MGRLELLEYIIRVELLYFNAPFGIEYAIISIFYSITRYIVYIVN